MVSSFAPMIRIAAPPENWAAVQSVRSILRQVRPARDSTIVIRNLTGAHERFGAAIIEGRVKSAREAAAWLDAHTAASATAAMTVIYNSNASANIAVDHVRREKPGLKC